MWNFVKVWTKPKRKRSPIAATTSLIDLILFVAAIVFLVATLWLMLFYL